jgi:hypothetical protein
MSTSHITEDASGILVDADAIAVDGLYAGTVTQIHDVDSITARQPTRVIIELDPGGDHVVKVKFADGYEYQHASEVYETASELETALTAQYQTEVEDKIQ